jgi:hypothetical protein
MFKNEVHRARVQRAQERVERADVWRVVSVSVTDRVEEVFCAVVPGVESFALADELLTMNCPFFTRCRPPVADAQNQIMNPDLARMVHVAFEARKTRKDAAVLEAEAVELLKGVTGMAGSVSCVTTVVNKKTGAYMKVDLREVAV